MSSKIEPGVKAVDLTGSNGNNPEKASVKPLTMFQRIYGTVFDTEEKPPRPVWLIICQDVPCVNLIFDMVFDENPSTDGLKDMMNLIGLIDALILGFVLSLLTAIDYDEIVAADNRFIDPSIDGTPPGYGEYYNGDNWRDSASPSASYSFYCYTSILFLFASLISVLLIYLDYVNKEFEAKSKIHAEELFSAWWKYGRIATLLCFIECVLGVIYAAGSLTFILVIKYPDYYVENHGAPNVNSVNYPYGGYQLLSIPLCTLIFICIVLLGMGTRTKYRRSRKYARKENGELDMFKKGQDFKKWTELLDNSCRDFVDGIILDELLNEIANERIRFADCTAITGEHLTKLGVSRLGHQMAILDACRKVVQ